MTWPTVDGVEHAPAVTLMRWNRRLPAPRTPHERAAAQRVAERLADIRERWPLAYVNASKVVGW